MRKGYTRRKRNFLIKRDFQGKLILSTFLFVSGGCFLFIVLLSYFSADTLTISYSKNGLEFGQTPIMLLKQILTANWILIVIGGTFLVIASMMLSHRIAGPLFRFEKALDNMNAGLLDDTIRLRGKDEGKELATKINHFNLQLSQNLRIIDRSSEALEALIEQTSTLNLSKKEQEQLASLCWSMQEQNRKVRRVCSSFQLINE